MIFQYGWDNVVANQSKILYSCAFKVDTNTRLQYTCNLTFNLEAFKNRAKITIIKIVLGITIQYKDMVKKIYKNSDVYLT